MLGARLPAAAPALTLLLLLGLAPATPTPSSVSSTAIQSADTLLGTVRSVREGAGVEIVTGFHLALKVVYVRVGPETRIEVADQSAELGDLRPGQVVRIRYEETDEGMRAQRIQVVRPERQGGAS